MLPKHQHCALYTLASGKIDTFVAELAGEGNELTKADMELRLVQSKHDIENPILCVKAEPL